MTIARVLAAAVVSEVADVGAAVRVARALVGDGHRLRPTLRRVVG